MKFTTEENQEYMTRVIQERFGKTASFVVAIKSEEDYFFDMNSSFKLAIDIARHLIDDISIKYSDNPSDPQAVVKTKVDTVKTK